MFSTTTTKLFSGGLLLSALALSMSWAPATQADIVFSDGFGDGDLNNDGASDSGAVVDDVADVGVPFYRARGASTTAATLVTDNGVGGIGSGLALKFEPNTSASRILSAGFDDTTLANIGESIVLSFDVRLDATVPSNAGLRFGLHNNGGPAIGADFDGNNPPRPTAMVADTGVFEQLDTGTISGNAVDFRYEPTGDVILGGIGNTFLGASTDAASTLTDTTAKNISLTVTLVDIDVLELTYAADGTEFATVRTDSGSGVASPTLTFNQFAIGNASSDLDFFIDNVQVEFVVPEPGAVSLLACGVLGLLRRR